MIYRISISLIISSLLFLLQLPAQNFSTIRTDSTLFYFGEELFTVAFDSVEADNGDTTIYLYRYTQTDTALPGNCTLFTSGISWMGPKVVMDSSLHIYFNKDGDSIFIDISVSGGNFIMYKFPNGDYVEASHTGTDLKQVFHVADQVKALRMQVKDSMGNNIAHPLNGRTFSLTRNYGFYETYKWYDFPEDTTKLAVLGSMDQGFGIGNTDAHRIFHILPGNELHYRTVHETCGFSGCITTTSLEKRFTLERALSSGKDTLELLFQRVKFTITDDPVEGIDSSFVIDSISETFVFSDYAFLDSFNRELFKWKTGYGYSIINFPDSTHNPLDSSQYRSRRELFLDFQYDSINHCLSPQPASLPKFIYGDGLGLTYFFDDTAGVTTYKKELIYYQKGLEKWGEPVNFSKILSVPGNPGNLKVTVYPNPVSGQLFIETDGTAALFDLQIYDQAGRLVREVNEVTGALQIDMATYPRGVYFLHGQGATFQFREKIIVQ